MSVEPIDPERCEPVHEITEDTSSPSGSADLGGRPHRFAPERDDEGVWTGAFVATPVDGGQSRRVGLYLRHQQVHDPDPTGDDRRLEASWYEWPAHGQYQRFGDRTQFAIDIMLEPCPCIPVVQGRNLAGRFRLWFAGQEVGDFGGGWIRGPVEELVEMRDRIGDLWDPTFVGLSDERIFDRLDWLCHAAHRGGSLFREMTAADRQEIEREKVGKDWHRFFLAPGDEIYDGWKLVVVQPSAMELLALFLCYAEEEEAHPHELDVHACRFPVDAFVTAVTACADWLAARERELLPRVR